MSTICFRGASSLAVGLLLLHQLTPVNGVIFREGVSYPITENGASRMQTYLRGVYKPGDEFRVASLKDGRAVIYLKKQGQSREHKVELATHRLNSLYSAK